MILITENKYYKNIKFLHIFYVTIYYFIIHFNYIKVIRKIVLGYYCKSLILPKNMYMYNVYLYTFRKYSMYKLGKPIFIKISKYYALRSKEIFFNMLQYLHKAK